MKSAFFGGFLFCGMVYFQGQIIDNFFPPQSTELACFKTKETHFRVRSCLAANRPSVECLAEARALCLKDLADEEK
jgi:hypothetical protein